MIFLQKCHSQWWMRIYHIMAKDLIYLWWLSRWRRLWAVKFEMEILAVKWRSRHHWIKSLKIAERMCSFGPGYGVDSQCRGASRVFQKRRRQIREHNQRHIRCRSPSCSIWFCNRGNGPSFPWKIQDHGSSNTLQVRATKVLQVTLQWKFLSYTLMILQKGHRKVSGRGKWPERNNQYAKTAQFL